MTNRPFTMTFLRWSAAANLSDILRPKPRSDGDAVDLHFLVGDGALEGYACDYDLSVAAVLRSENWDLLYTDELAPEQSADGWHCTLCLDDPPRHNPSLEALWIAHLFEPFGRWCDEKLRGAPGISYYGDGGITSAKLGKPEDGAVHFQRLDWADVQSINR